MARLGLYAQSQPADVTLDDPGLATGEVSPGANRVAFAPNTQRRVMVADRAKANYVPGNVSYANVDSQIGGAPGDPGGSIGGITSESPTGVTTHGGIPVSPYIEDYGEAEWTGTSPTWTPKHQNIVRESNPNRPQINPTPDHPEGPTMPTAYVQPGPWAQGVYLGT